MEINMENVIRTSEGIKASGSFSTPKLSRSTAPKEKLRISSIDNIRKTLEEPVDKASISENAMKIYKENGESNLKGIDELQPEIENDDINNELDKIQSSRINYVVDKDHDVILQLIDSKTNEVIREIPPEEQARVSKAMEKIMEEANQPNKTKKEQINTMI